MANATQKRASQGLTAGKGDAYDVKCLVATHELATATAAGATVDFGKIPSNARLLGRPSMLYWDDLASTAATFDLGFAPVDSNITADPDALSDGHDIATAGSGAALGTAVDRVGVHAWDLTTAASDPGGELIVRGTVADAANNIAGTVTLELYYYLD